MTKNLKTELKELLEKTENGFSLSAENETKLIVEHSGLDKESVEKLYKFNRDLHEAGAEILVDDFEENYVKSEHNDVSEDESEMEEDDYTSSITYNHGDRTTIQAFSKQRFTDDDDGQAYTRITITTSLPDSTNVSIAKRVKELLECDKENEN